MTFWSDECVLVTSYLERARPEDSNGQKGQDNFPFFHLWKPFCKNALRCSREINRRIFAGAVTKSVSCKMNLDLRFNAIILKGHLSTFFLAL